MKRFAIPLLLLFIIYAIAIIAYHNLEGWDYLDSVYFATTTLTTVGYGDLYPTHPTSKIFTIFYIWVGIGLGFYLIYSLSNYYKNVVSKKAEKVIDRGKKIIGKIENGE